MYDELHHLNSPLLYGGSNPNIAETAATYGGQEYTPPLHTNPSLPTSSPSPTTTDAAPHMGASPEVTVTAPEKRIVGSMATAISPTPAPVHTKPPGGYGQGTTYPGYNRSLSQHTNDVNYQQANNPTVYRTSLMTNSGTEIPTGSTGQSPAERLAHVSGTTGQTAAEMIGQEGSISDIANTQQYGPVPTTPDVQMAVNQTASAGQRPINLAPKKKGR